MNLDDFYLTQSEPNRSCLLNLRKIILEAYPEISETRKYGMPCFCLRKKALCYLWTDKKTGWPYVLFVEGIFLSHPALEAGSRRRMAVFYVQPARDLPVNELQKILGQAIELLWSKSKYSR